MQRYGEMGACLSAEPAFSNLSAFLLCLGLEMRPWLDGQKILTAPKQVQESRIVAARTSRKVSSRSAQPEAKKATQPVKQSSGPTLSGRFRLCRSQPDRVHVLQVCICTHCSRSSRQHHANAGCRGCCRALGCNTCRRSKTASPENIPTLSSEAARAAAVTSQHAHAS